MEVSITMKTFYRIVFLIKIKKRDDTGLGKAKIKGK